MASIYMCPVCRSPLDRQDKQFLCTRGHTFDIAREGYVNLLLAHQKKTADPGDRAEMIRSRRAFLARGHYDELSRGLNEAVSGLFRRPEKDHGIQLLDAGCGEGFYLWKLADHLGSQGLLEVFGLWGLDISRSAIRYAARRDKLSEFVVGSTYRLPILPGCLDAALRIFAPGDDEEFRRILKPGGKLLTLGPGPRHLAQLREMIYTSPEDHRAKAKGPSGFECLEQTRISYRLYLEHEDIGNLVEMTPYYWHMDRDTQERVSSLDTLETEIDVVLTVYQKT